MFETDSVPAKLRSAFHIDSSTTRFGSYARDLTTLVAECVHALLIQESIRQLCLIVASETP